MKIKAGDWIEYKDKGNENLEYAKVMEVKNKTVIVDVSGFTFKAMKRVKIEDILTVNNPF